MDVSAMAGILAGISGSHAPEPSVPVLVVEQILKIAIKIDWAFLTGVDPDKRWMAIQDELTMHLCNNPFLKDEREGKISIWNTYTAKQVAELLRCTPENVRTAKSRKELRTSDDPEWVKIVSRHGLPVLTQPKKDRKDQLFFHGAEVKRWKLGVGKDDSSRFSVLSRFADIQDRDAVEERLSLEERMRVGQSQGGRLYIDSEMEQKARQEGTENPRS